MEYIGDRRVIVLINKIDLGRTWKQEEITRSLPNSVILETSMLEKTGIDKIEEQILNLVYSGTVKQNDSLLVTSVRHKELLDRAKGFLTDALAMTRAKEAMDFIEVDKIYG